MKSEDVVRALGLPPAAFINQRIPKKMLIENAVTTAAEKKLINQHIDELKWTAVIKPASVGIPAFNDERREYLEVAVLELSYRAGCTSARIATLIHRAIPYPLMLIQEDVGSATISLTHLRRSQSAAGETVLDGDLYSAELRPDKDATCRFLESLGVTKQPQGNLRDFYQGWVLKVEAYAASHITGQFVAEIGQDAALQRRTALAEHERLTKEISSLRAKASKERQVSRRVEFNMKLKELESLLAKSFADL